MHVSNEDLLQAYKNHKDMRVKERLHAICMMQVQGRSMAETADILFRTYQFVHKWHDRYEKYGFIGLEEGSRCGRPPKISPNIMMQIEKKFTKIGTITLPKQVRDYIKNMTGITYHITHICRLMREWKLKSKVPQKIHANACIIR